MISVIIATKDRPKKLLNCLKSIAVGKYKNYEVILVDQNLSVDRELSRYVENNSKIIFLHSPGNGKSVALGQGLSRARGKIIAFVDDDCLVSKNWLTTIFQAFRVNNCDVIFGQVLPYRPTQHAGLICPSTILFNQKEFVHRPRYHVHIGYGNNMTFKRETLDEIGPPKSWLGPGSIGENADDAELTLRALLAKKVVMRNPDLIVFHNRWLSPAVMQQQEFSYKVGEAACYGYFALHGYAFAKAVIKQGLKRYWSAFKNNLKLLISRRRNKKVLNEIYISTRWLQASFWGLLVASWYWLFDPIKLRKSGRRNYLTVKGLGNSMWPFFHSDAVVRLHISQKELIRLGDLVLVKGKNRFIHRVIEVRDNKYLVKGDGNFELDGWFSRGQIKGKVVGFYTHHRYLSMGKPMLRFLNLLAVPLSRWSLDRPWLIRYYTAVFRWPLVKEFIKKFSTI